MIGRGARTGLRVDRRVLALISLAALAALPAQAQIGGSPLPVSDQIALYTEALRATRARREYFDQPGRLLLVPLANPSGIIADSSGVRRDTTWLDTAVVGALLRSRSVEGICLPGRHADRCGNDERGVGVRLGIFSYTLADTVRALVHVETQLMQADRDNVQLLGGPRTDTWMFVRTDSGWRIRLPTRHGPP